MPRQPEVDSVVVDFEAGLWQAIREAMPGREIHGCAFHWTQVVWRKATEIELSSAYRHDDGTNDLIRMVLGLPFLPENHRAPAFRQIRGLASTPQLEVH